MTPEIEAALEKASTLAEIEDIYRPFRPKRRTRASIAKEKGLEPLADAIFAQTADSASPTELAADYIDAEKGVETVEDAINGAMDIIAENISDDADIRRRLRSLFTVAGVLQRAPQTAKKRASIRCIMNMTSRSIKLPVTACLPSTGARTKASSKSA